MKKFRGCKTWKDVDQKIFNNLINDMYIKLGQQHIQECINSILYGQPRKTNDDVYGVSVSGLLGSKVCDFK